MWNLPGPGIELVFPALAGGFFTTAPPGKPKEAVIVHMYVYVSVGLYYDTHVT